MQAQLIRRQITRPDNENALLTFKFRKSINGNKSNWEMAWNAQGFQSQSNGNRVSVSQAQQKSYSEIPTSLRSNGSQANLETRSIRYSNALVNTNQKFDRNPT